MLHIPSYGLLPSGPPKYVLITEDVQAGTGGSREGDAVRRVWLEQEAVQELHWHHSPLSSAPVFSLAQPHLPLPKRAQQRPGAVGKALVYSSRQKWRWMARELLGVEWGWSSTTILSPSPLSTAPSPDSSQCRPWLLATSSPGRSPPASSPSALCSMWHRETPIQVTQL